MFYSIVIYSVAFSLSILNLSIVQNKHITLKKNRLAFLNYFWKFLFIFYPLIIIYGWRYKVGTDYLTYLETYKFLKNASFETLKHFYMEPGYVFLNLISKFLFAGDNGIFIISGIVILGLVYLNMLTYKEWVDKRIFLFTFLMAYWGLANNAIRQTIAILIILYGYSFLLRKKNLHFITACTLAALFHTSAIFCVSVIIVNHIKPNNYRKFKILCFLVGAFFVLFSNNVVGLIASFNVFARYTVTFEKMLAVTNKIGSLKFLLYLIPLLFYVEKYKLNTGVWVQKWQKLLLIFYFQIPFQCLGSASIAVERMSIYFSCIQILLVSSIVKANQHSKEQRMSTVVFCIIWYVFYFIVTSIILQGNGISTFQFWK